MNTFKKIFWNRFIILKLAFSCAAIFAVIRYYPYWHWVLVDSPVEVFSGDGYDWPWHVTMAAYGLIVFSFFLLTAVAGIWFGWRRGFRFLAFLPFSVFSVGELQRAYGLYEGFSASLFSSKEFCFSLLWLFCALAILFFYSAIAEGSSKGRRQRSKDREARLPAEDRDTHK